MSHLKHLQLTQNTDNINISGAAKEEKDEEKLTEIDINQAEAFKSMKVLETFESKEGEDIDELVLVLTDKDTSTSAAISDQAEKQAQSDTSKQQG